MKVDAAPKLDGVGDDAAWAKAAETVIPVAGGANNGSTKVSLKSVYSGDSVYFLATWDDPDPELHPLPVGEAGGRHLEDHGRPQRQGRRQQQVVRGQVRDHLADQQHASRASIPPVAWACATSARTPTRSRSATSTPPKQARWATSGTGSRCATWVRSTTSTSTTPATRPTRPMPAARATPRNPAVTSTT